MSMWHVRDVGMDSAWNTRSQLTHQLNLFRVWSWSTCSRTCNTLKVIKSSHAFSIREAGTWRKLTPCTKCYACDQVYVHSVRQSRVADTLSLKSAWEEKERVRHNRSHQNLKYGASYVFIYLFLCLFIHNSGCFLLGKWFMPHIVCISAADAYICLYSVYNKVLVKLPPITTRQREACRFTAVCFCFYTTVNVESVPFCGEKSELHPYNKSAAFI